jgi:hypothetical protein
VCAILSERSFEEFRHGYQPDQIIERAIVEA